MSSRIFTTEYCSINGTKSKVVMLPDHDEKNSNNTTCFLLVHLVRKFIAN